MAMLSEAARTYFVHESPPSLPLAITDSGNAQNTINFCTNRTLVAIYDEKSSWIRTRTNPGSYPPPPPHPPIIVNPMIFLQINNQYIKIIENNAYRCYDDFVQFLGH